MVKKSLGASAETWTYTYDHDGRLTGASRSATDGGAATATVAYTYDAWGNRLGRTAWDGATTTTERWAYDGWDPAKPSPVGSENFDPWADLDGANAVTARRLWGAGFDDPEARAAGAAVSWYAADLTGSVRKVLNTSGGVTHSVAYDAFGQLTAGAPADRYGYAGREWDGVAQTYYNRDRVYDPRTGRFLSEDPAGLAPDVNPYRYVHNQPTTRTDPSGRYWFARPSTWSHDGTDAIKAELKRHNIPVEVIKVGRAVFGATDYEIIYVPKEHRGRLEELVTSDRFAGNWGAEGRGLTALMDDPEHHLEVHPNLKVSAHEFAFTDDPGIRARIAQAELEDRASRQSRIGPGGTPSILLRNGDHPLVQLGHDAMGSVVGPPLRTAGGIFDSLAVTIDPNRDPQLNPHLADALAGLITVEEAERRMVDDAVSTGFLLRLFLLGRGSGSSCPPAAGPLSGGRPRQLDFPPQGRAPLRVPPGGGTLRSAPPSATIKVGPKPAAPDQGLSPSVLPSAGLMANGQPRPPGTGVDTDTEGSRKAVCFGAGTPLLTPGGWKPIEEFKPGDLVLTRPEGDQFGDPEAKAVEEVFVSAGPTLTVTVSGREVLTTAEHPFFVLGRGWTAAAELAWGDVLASHNGAVGVVEGVAESPDQVVLYNLRVADHHTYFVGQEEWGFSLWAHNACVKFEQVTKADPIGMAYAKMGWEDHTEAAFGRDRVSFGRNIAYAKMTRATSPPGGSTEMPDPAHPNRRVSQRGGPHAEEQLIPFFRGERARGRYVANMFSDRHPCDHIEHMCAQNLTTFFVDQPEDNGLVIVYYIIPYVQNSDDAAALEAAYRALGFT